MLGADIGQLVILPIASRRKTYFGNDPYVPAEAGWETRSVVFSIGKVVEATVVEGLLEVLEVESLDSISMAQYSNV